MKRMVFLFVLLVFAIGQLSAQVVRGSVRDSESGTPLANVRVYYANHRSMMVQTDSMGFYRVEYRKGDLVFSLLGYDSKIVAVRQAGDVDVTLAPADKQMRQVEIVHKRTKYTRRNNPAVDLMRRVIAGKEKSRLSAHDYVSFQKYEKLTTSLMMSVPSF